MIFVYTLQFKNRKISSNGTKFSQTDGAEWLSWNVMQVNYINSGAVQTEELLYWFTHNIQFGFDCKIQKVNQEVIKSKKLVRLTPKFAYGANLKFSAIGQSWRKPHFKNSEFFTFFTSTTPERGHRNHLDPKSFQMSLLCKYLDLHTP